MKLQLICARLCLEIQLKTFFKISKCCPKPPLIKYANFDILSCIGNYRFYPMTNNPLLVQCQAIIWTNAAILFTGINLRSSEILIEISIFSFTKMHLKMLSAQWRSFCCGLNALKTNMDHIVLWFRYIYSIGIVPIDISTAWHDWVGGVMVGAYRVYLGCSWNSPLVK